MKRKSVFRISTVVTPMMVVCGSALLLLPASASAQGPVFGPKQYTRMAGPPQTFTETFSRCGGSPCQLVVVNGNANGSNRVSGASISLNGLEILGPRDFNQQLARIVRPVTLADNDQLTIRLTSNAGSFLTISVVCASTASLGIPQPAGVISAIWPNGTVALSIPLENQGNVSAANVMISNIQADSGAYIGPTAFQYSAGDLTSDQTQTLNAEFTMTPAQAQSAFPLTVSGTYGFGAIACTFQAQATVTPPPAGNGGSPKLRTTVTTFTAATATYPPGPLFNLPADQTNDAESQYNPPLGQPRNLFPTPPAQSALDLFKAFTPNDQTPPPNGSLHDVVFLRNQQVRGYSGLPPDPSVAGATPTGFVLISANTAVSYSRDYGKTFTTVYLTACGFPCGSGFPSFSDPSQPSRTDFFPESDGGLCCDQVVHYIPSRNLVVWLLQYRSPTINVNGLSQKAQNRLRIAYATPQAAAADFLHAWTWFDITPALLGDNTVTDAFDYPDLAFSNDWLYISVNHVYWNPKTDSQGNVLGQQAYSARRWLIRSSLNDMASSAGTVNLVYYEAVKNGVVNAHFAQSAPDAMYYAAQPDTSTLSVFADPDSSPNIPSPKDIAVTSLCILKATNSCLYPVFAPDNQNWNQAPHSVIGATYVAPVLFCPPEGCSGPTRFLYFANDGGLNVSLNRPFPYVRIEKIDADALNLISELDIWNDNFAFATAALTWRPGLTTAKDEVAISLAVGGGGKYADNAVGFLGDFIVYATTSSNTTQCALIGGCRYGDYFHVRNAVGPVTQAGQGVGYSTLAYGVTTQTVNCSNSDALTTGGCVNFQYVLFGRNADLFPTPIPPVR